MNPDHLVKADFVSELVADSWTSDSDRNFNGASISTWETLPNQWDPYFDLSDRATFLLALDVLRRRFQGPNHLQPVAEFSENDWHITDFGEVLSSFGLFSNDPIHALKLALEATAEKP